MVQWAANYSGRTNYDLYVVIDLVSQDIGANTSTVRIQMFAHSKSGGGSWAVDNFAWSLTGTWSFSGARNLDFRPDSAGKVLYMLDTYQTVGHAADGTLSVALRGVHSTTSVFGSADTGTQWFTLPTIPRTPSSLTVTRVADEQHALNWVRNSTYTSVVIQRQTNDGAWQQIAVAAGNAASFTDTTTIAAQKYTYRVAGGAAAGWSGWSNTASVFTTPPVPTGLAATRSSNDISVAATVAGYTIAVDIQDETTTVVSGLAVGSLPWTHVTPNPAVPHRYRARASLASGGVGSTTLYSAWSVYSNTVQLLSAPNPPTGLNPNGAVRPVDETIQFQWTHNPVDSSAQTAYELRHRVPAGAWTTLSGTTASSRTVTLPVGDREWQVRTKGSHPDWSAWSATAVVTVIDRPGVAVTQPDGTWDASLLTVTWSWLQAQGRPQSAWQLELISAGIVIESQQGSGASGSVVLATKLTQGAWTLRVRAATGDVWSVWASEAFVVTFDPPAAPVVSGVWDETQGGVALAVAAGVDPALDPTVRIVVERAIAGIWEVVVDLTAGATLIDWESLSYGDTQYRATAYTVENATAATTITVQSRSDSLWLSTGVRFGITGRLPLNPEVTHTVARERALKHYAGRKLPVGVTGEALHRSIDVAGNVWDAGETATVQRLREIVQSDAEQFLFRDPDGRRIYGVVDQISIPRIMAADSGATWNGYWGYRFTFTETEAR
ncbi:hypothetical protein CQ047_17800 [Microbacterium sp. MYb72]|uniref:DUF859 family phage minor structural protein n=1 Tax=Microbacterium sp. MYb72 TaxID=1848693 RepID=UPI000CFAF956|nr:DUF859 family phage minor structural protein [Microbacterium sp. MYb72]PRB02758.1 hypothetical protein CQ047_17800 [Microbacterium sp. MYb72]